MKLFTHLKYIIYISLLLVFWGIITVPAEASSPLPKLTTLTFDADYYYNKYPDLQTAIGTDSSALYNHYINNGLKEGRYGSPEFNCSIYMDNNSDLRTAFKNDYFAYCIHYEQFGKEEGRNAITPIHSKVNKSENVLGTYTSSYDATEPRAINVELAASRINNIVIAPGEEFSYSQTILPRTAENGYVEAPMISNKIYTKGMGGGICQVSSTLYAAMLEAGIPATERHPHSLPVDYVPEGMDATIAAPVKDLRFVNILDYDIYILASTDSKNGEVTVSIVK